MLAYIDAHRGEYVRRLQDPCRQPSIAAPGREPLVLPTMAGTGPMHVLTGTAGIPTIGSDVGYAHSNGHAPNGNIRVDDDADGIKHIATVLYLFGGGR